jgi:hypothetical protein
MASLETRAHRPLPGWLMVLGSAFAVGHLLTIGLLALAPPSGPWPTRFGDLEADGPLFAQSITNSFTYPYYLRPLRLTHNYHFQTNRVDTPAIYFEVKLRDASGEVFKTLKFPDEKANFWVRHRQGILAQGLGGDQPVQPRGPTMIAAPAKQGRKIEFWDMTEGGVLKLKEVAEHELPPDRTMFRPAEASKVLAKAYMRHLCRDTGAAAVELIRYSREAIMPVVLLMPQPPTQESLSILKSHFGEYRREN